MLKGIPPILSPKLLYCLSAMGHGDRLVIADANFPGHTIGRRGKVIRLDGIKIPELLEAVLKVFPLDHTASPVTVMALCEADRTLGKRRPNWKQLLEDHGVTLEIAELERSVFYEACKEAFAVIITGDTRPYGNLILTKGVIEQ